MVKHSKSKIILSFLGPPGAGKGTQINKIKSYLSTYYPTLAFANLSTGEEMRKRGLHNSSGHLADKDIVNRLVDDFLRLDVDLIILDGYPRSIEQSQHLVDLVSLGQNSLHAVIFNIDDASAVNRLKQRVVCHQCGYICKLSTGTTNCGNCEVEMQPRQDDTSEQAIRKRLSIYRESIEDIKQVFQQRGQNWIHDFDALNFNGALDSVLDSDLKNIIDNCVNHDHYQYNS